MAIVIEAASRGQTSVQGFLPAMPEWRMAQVVAKAKRFRQVLVKAQRPSHGSADLRHFQRMSQANAKMIAVGRDEYLRFVTKAAECHRVDYPVAVALEGIAGPARAAIVFREGPAARS